MRPGLLAVSLALWLMGAGLSCRGHDAAAPAWQHTRSWHAVAYCVDLGPACSDAPVRERVLATLERHLASLDGSVAVAVLVWDEESCWRWQSSASEGALRLRAAMESSRLETFAGFDRSVRDAFSFLHQRWLPDKVGIVYLSPLASEGGPAHDLTEREKQQLSSLLARNWARVPVDTVGLVPDDDKGDSPYLERLASGSQGSYRRLRL